MPSPEPSMPDANRLYIGEGVSIKGEISVPDTLVVCGALEGDVSVGNLVVGETGSVKGRISVAGNAEISGKVFEKLDVKHLLILHGSSRVDGNVSYGILQIEQGASIAGGLSSVDYQPEQKPAKADSHPRRADGNANYGFLQIEQSSGIAGGLSSLDYRAEQKAAKVDAASGREPRSSKQRSVTIPENSLNSGTS